MAFSYSGGVITQTGTDTDLSGLSGLTGVDTLSVGSGAFKKTTYKLSGSKLLVTGTLTMNSNSVEYLEFSSNALDYSLDISATGTFTFGKQVTSGTAARSSHPCGGIYFSKVYSDHYQGKAFRNSGTVYWYGVIGGRHVPIATLGSGSWIIRDGVWQSDELIFAFGLNQPNLFFHASGTLDVDGFTLHQESLFVRVNSGTITKFDNVRAIISQGVAQNENSSTPFELRGYSPKENICDISVYRGNPQTRGVKSINSPLGNNVYVGGSDTSSQSFGWVEMWQEVIFDVKDISGASVNNVKMYLQDTDNGNRTTSYTGTDGILYSTDRVYEETFNGVSNQVDILIGVVASAAGIARPGYDTGLSRVDRRSLSDAQGSRDNPSDFRFKLINYENNIIDSIIDITNDDVKTLNLTIIKDILITETSSSTVSAYTTIDDARELYDRAKIYLYDNYTGETSTIIGRAGSQVDLKEVNLIIDATSASVFSYSEIGDGTITIKSNIFTGGASATTGKVTLSNGALLNGGTFDCDIDYHSGANTTITNVVCNGVLDFNTSGDYILDGCVINEVTNSSSGNVTIDLVNGSTITTNTGPNITLEQNVTISAPNILDDSRVQVYNVTKSLELDNLVVSGGNGVVCVENLLSSNIDDGDTIRMRVTYQVGVIAKLPLEITGVVSASGLTFINSQVDDVVYNTIGLDGSLITEFSSDVINNEIDIVVAANFSAHRLYSRYVYFTTLENEIRVFFGAVIAEDLGNIKNNVSVQSMYLNNNTSSNLIQTDNVRLYRSDGAYPARTTTTGGGGMDIVWRNQILIAETGTSGLTPSESNKLDSINNLTKLIPATL